MSDQRGSEFCAPAGMGNVVEMVAEARAMAPTSERPSDADRHPGSRRRVLLALLIMAAAPTAPTSAIREGGCVTPVCDLPSCAYIRGSLSSETPSDCYCADAAAGVVRHYRVLSWLRRIHFTGVVRGSDAAPDEYRSKPIPGGGSSVGLTGPIRDVPLSLRGASAVHPSGDGVQLFVKLQPERELLVLDRDPETGAVSYNSVARFRAPAERDAFLAQLAGATAAVSSGTE